MGCRVWSTLLSTWWENAETIECVVPGCEKRYGRYTLKQVSFHCFPTNAGQCRLWVIPTSRIQYQHTGGGIKCATCVWWSFYCKWLLVKGVPIQGKASVERTLSWSFRANYDLIENRSKANRFQREHFSVCVPNVLGYLFFQYSQTVAHLVSK